MGPLISCQEMIESPPATAAIGTGLSFRPVIQPKVRAVPRFAYGRPTKQDEEEFRKGEEYLKLAITLYHQSNPKQTWSIGLAETVDELFAMWADKKDLVLFSYSPPSQKINIAGRIKRSLIQKGLARNAGSSAGSIVFVVMN